MKIQFGPFILDLDTRQLTRESREIHLAPKAFELLATLVADRPKVLSKEVLQQRLWPETFVAEANLSNLVAEIREALGDRARTPLFVRTAHGFGYAFCGDATTLPGARETEPERPSCWLEWAKSPARPQHPVASFRRPWCGRCSPPPVLPAAGSTGCSPAARHEPGFAGVVKEVQSLSIEFRDLDM